MSKQEQHKTLKRFSEYFTKRHKVLINLIKDLTNTPKHYLETMNKEYEKLKSAFVRDYSKCLLFEEIDEICSFQQENEFQLTSKSVDTQMQELKKQEGSIKRARSDIIKRDKALNKREKKIDQRYADITAKEVALEKRAKNMDKKRKNLRKLLQKRVQHSNAGQSTTLLDEKLMQFQ